MNIANGTVEKEKHFFRKTIRKNKGGYADWKSNMSIIGQVDTIRRKVDGKWLPEEKGVFLPAGTCVIEGCVKTHDFDGNPYPDNEGRLEITIKPWGHWKGKDGKIYGDELSVSNLQYDGQNKGRYFDKITNQFQLITEAIAKTLNMMWNIATNNYEYNSQGVKAVSVDSENVDAPLESSGVETVRTQQPFEKDESFLSKSAPATITTDFDDDIPF
tara:strand:- start:1522 stop:2166 length:645 start_codon:yes stop_codon:yes gene_type:complete